MLYEKASSECELFRVNLTRTTDAELEKISRERGLSLSLREMRLIQEYFRKRKREPFDVELEAIAQTWSEHCGHKTFKSEFVDERGKRTKSLFKTFIFRATKQLNLGWCYSVFEDNAGIVDFEGDHAIAFKVETHNHPSALEPFGGAATGVGGVIRDVLGVWGDPIANTDVLCFGPLDLPESKLPKGVKHPRYLYSGVVAGIGAYGNNMGIPTVNGAIYFDESYTGNPLVYCGTVGLVRKSRFVKAAKAGDVALVVGGRTGRDGIHGVTFASAELHEKSEETSRSAVQIGDPIQEEKIKRALMIVRDQRLASSVTDFGGGGLSSALSETGERYGLGAVVHLDRMPLKYPIRAPWEIWVSESQERMLLTVSKKNVARVKKIFADEEVEATVVGEFNSGRKLRLFFKKILVADLDMEFLFTQPTTERKIVSFELKAVEPTFAEPKDLAPALHKILAAPNVCSKESVVRTYDHEVKGSTVIKPLQGVAGDGPGDAAVLKPLADSWKGIAVSNGFNPEYGKVSAYAMAASAIDEAIRNNVCVGGRRIALLDNFSWGNPEKPDRASALFQAAKACYDYATAFGTPFISGKDSLYNECAGVPVTPTLLVSALGILPDVRNAVTMDAKHSGNLVFVVGETLPELGGSHYYKISGVGLGASVPGVEALKARKTFSAITKAIDFRLIEACHDCSEGGLGVAATEMAFSGNLGIKIYLRKLVAPEIKKKKRSDYALFSESNSRFVVEVKPENEREFKKALKGVALAKAGEVTKDKTFAVTGLNGRTVLKASLDSLKKSWQSGFLRFD